MSAPAPFTVQNPVIANGASLSGAVCMGNHVAMAIQMPAAWTAASLTFQASLDGTTYGDVYDDGGNEYVVAAAVNNLIILDPGKFPTGVFIKVRSGTGGTPVTQGAARTLAVYGRRIGDKI